MGNLGTCKVLVTEIFTLGSWRGIEWQAKVKVQSGGGAPVKPINQLGRAVLAP